MSISIKASNGDTATFIAIHADVSFDNLTNNRLYRRNCYNDNGEYFTVNTTRTLGYSSVFQLKTSDDAIYNVNDFNIGEINFINIGEGYYQFANTSYGPGTSTTSGTGRYGIWVVCIDNQDNWALVLLNAIDLSTYSNVSNIFGVVNPRPSNNTFGMSNVSIRTSVSDAYFSISQNSREYGNILKQLVSDPFSPGGTSEPGGGGGTFDDESDEIPDSSLPTLSAANTGFTRIYNPTLSQVQNMANYLWTDESVIQTIWNHIKQFLENPMDAFIAFNLVPCAVPDGGTQNFKVMYIDTGVSMTVAANQFVDVDCGTVELDRYYGSALDFTPYTRVGCFLPYIGTVELDADEVIGRTLHVVYRIDIVSGACVAKIAVDGNYIYQYSGHCAINIPFTSADFSNYMSAIIQVAKAAMIAASGGVMAGAVEAEEAMQLTGQVVSETISTERNPSTGRQITMSTERTERSYYQSPSTKASYAGLTPANIANTVAAVMNAKPLIEHGGGFNGNSGYLGVRRPYLIIKRPRMCNPDGYGRLNGYPCMIKETLSNLSGYTQVQQVQLTGLSATNPEQAEILTLLKSGVIL